MSEFVVSVDYKPDIEVTVFNCLSSGGGPFTVHMDIRDNVTCLCGAAGCPHVEIFALHRRIHELEHALMRIGAEVSPKVKTGQILQDIRRVLGAEPPCGWGIASVRGSMLFNPLWGGLEEAMKKNREEENDAEVPE